MNKATKIYFILFTITLVLLTALITTNNIRIKPYRNLEKDVINAMEKYYGQDTNLKKLPQKEKKVKITIDELKDFGIEINTNINDDTCTGYGIVTGLAVSHKYQSFIKCNKYISKNYEN